MTPRHFAIFQIWGLGDLVMTTPVIAEFRRLHPSSKLTLVVRGGAQAALMRDSSLIDEILEMPVRSDARGMIKFFAQLRKQKVDAAFIGTRISPGLPLLLKVFGGIPTIIGDGRNIPALYTVRNEVNPDVHRAVRMLDTLEMWSGRKVAGPSFPIPLSRSSVEAAQKLLSDMSVSPGRFVVIHTGSSQASGSAKRIPVEVARRIADHILSIAPDASVVYIFGPDEIELIPEFSDLGDRQILVSGQPLHSTIAIIAQSSGFIGTDSSLGHIAAAFDVPTVTLCGPTIPSETAPYGSKAAIVKRVENLDCQPCWGTPLYGRCPFGTRCMHELPEFEIFDLIDGWDLSSGAKWSPSKRTSGNQ